MRKLKAVWAEELKHLVNVVVFSSLGERPEQNKMSGGDLDGDGYMVIWDSLLVEAFKEVYAPAEYEKKSRQSLQSLKEVDHIANFL